MGEAAAVSELAKRWAVALVGVPAVLALLYVGGWAMAAFCAVAAGMGAWECYRLAGRDAVAPLDGIGVGFAVALVLFAAWRPTFVGFAPVALALVGSFAMVGLVAAMFARGPTGSAMRPSSCWSSPPTSTPSRSRPTPCPSRRRPRGSLAPRAACGPGGVGTSARWTTCR